MPPKTNNFILLYDKLEPEPVVAIATALARETGNPQGVLAPSKVLDHPDILWHQAPDTVMLEDDPIIVSLSPASSKALFRYLGGSDRVKRTVGARDFCAIEFTQDRQMQMAALSQVGIPRAPEEYDDRLEFCFWVSGAHVWPVALFIDNLRNIAPEGGPFSFTGLSVIPVMAKKVSRLAEAVRLSCSSFNYSGPVFVTAVSTDDGLSIEGLEFRPMIGFWSCMIALMEERQSLSAWLHALQKGIFVTPLIREGVASVFLRASAHGRTLGSSVALLEKDSTQKVAFSINMRVPVQGEFVPFPEITVHLDLHSQFAYTYQRLEQLDIRLWNTQPKLKEVEEHE